MELPPQSQMTVLQVTVNIVQELHWVRLTIMIGQERADQTLAPYPPSLAGRHNEGVWEDGFPKLIPGKRH